MKSLEKYRVCRILSLIVAAIIFLIFVVVFGFRYSDSSSDLIESKEIGTFLICIYIVPTLVFELIMFVGSLLNPRLKEDLLLEDPKSYRFTYYLICFHLLFISAIGPFALLFLFKNGFDELFLDYKSGQYSFWSLCLLLGLWLLFYLTHKSIFRLINGFFDNYVHFRKTKTKKTCKNIFELSVADSLVYLNGFSLMTIMVLGVIAAFVILGVIVGVLLAVNLLLVILSNFLFKDYNAKRHYYKDGWGKWHWN